MASKYRLIADTSHASHAARVHEYEAIDYLDAVKHGAKVCREIGAEFLSVELIPVTTNKREVTKHDIQQ